MEAKSTRSSVMDEWAPQRRFRTFPACPVPRASAPPRARANPLEFPRPKTTSSPMQGDEDILTVTLGVGAAGLRLDRALAEALPNLSRERLKTLIKGGRVADERGAVLWDPSAKAAVPATLAVRLPAPAPAHNVAQDLSLVIAYRSEEHTSELQSLMRISYAVFCLNKKKQKQ